MLNKLVAKPLTQDQVESLISDKKNWILSYCTPEKIIITGSAARYEMTEASDIDLIVLFRDKQSLNEGKAKLLRNRKPNDWPHDLLLMDIDDFNAAVAKGGGMCWLAQREGLIIYDRCCK